MRKHYTAKQKAHLVLELLKEEKTIAQLASEHGVHPTQLYNWKAQALQGLPRLFEDDHKAEKAQQAAHEQQLQALYAEIGRLSTQLAWLKKKSGLEPSEK
jgi:transposase-like protein